MKRTIVVLLVVVAVIVAIVLSRGLRDRLVVSPDSLKLPADGATHRAVSVRMSRGTQINAKDMRAEGLPARIFPEGESSVAIEIRAPVNPGRQVLTLSYGKVNANLELNFVTDASDHFGDGTPDFLRLHSAADRAAFRGWFTFLADTAASLGTNSLPSHIDDSAALLRWCYINALHDHNVAWLATMPMGTLPPIPSPQQYEYPLTPVGTSPFRVRPGPYVNGDAKNGSFKQFADAETLWKLNTFLVSHDLQAARPGDLLFYRKLEQDSQYHSMIIIGGEQSSAVYDTGRPAPGPWKSQVRCGV